MALSCAIASTMVFAIRLACNGFGDTAHKSGKITALFAPSRERISDAFEFSTGD